MLIYDLYQKIEKQQTFSFWGIIVCGIFCVLLFCFYVDKKNEKQKYHTYKIVAFMLFVFIFNILLIYKEINLPKEHDVTIVNKKDYYVETDFDKKVLPFCEKLLTINKEGDININLLKECLEDHVDELSIVKKELLRGDKIYSVNKEWNDFLVKEIEADFMFKDFVLNKEKAFLGEIEKAKIVHTLNLYEMPYRFKCLTLNRYILKNEPYNIEYVKFSLKHKE